jgi:hypothetical protein
LSLCSEHDPKAILNEPWFCAVAVFIPGNSQTKVKKRIRAKNIKDSGQKTSGKGNTFLLYVSHFERNEIVVRLAHVF